MKKDKSFRVACYMRVGTKEQLDHYPGEESTMASHTDVPKEHPVEEDGDDHLVQQTMEIAY